MMLPGMIPVVVPSALSGITLTAGTDGARAGYSDGSFVAAFGSLSAEPLAGEMMSALYSEGTFNTTLVYHGNIAASLATMTLYVDGTPYSLAGAVNAGEGLASVQWTNNTGPIFVNGNAYSIRIE